VGLIKERIRKDQPEDCKCLKYFVRLDLLNVFTERLPSAVGANVIAWHVTEK
jgi:hypothetical protein